MNTEDLIEIVDKTEEYSSTIEVVEASTEFDQESSIEIVYALDETSVVSEDENGEKSIFVDESETFQPIVEYSEWQTPEDFENYIVASVRELPPTFKGSKNSLRRAFQYLKNIQAELIEGVEQDASYADLNEDQLQTLDSIEEGIEQALEHIAHTLDSGLTKTAKSARFVYYVSPFLHSIARVMINAKVSQGKNIEDVYNKLDSRYTLTDREKLELQFLLNDMGYPIRSSMVDHIDMMEQYFA